MVAGGRTRAGQCARLGRPGLGEFAKAIPYGVYDVGNDEGWVSVGDGADTAEIAVESIRRWWDTLGKSRSRPMTGTANGTTTSPVQPPEARVS
jgi:hypothetical protein